MFELFALGFLALPVCGQPDSMALTLSTDYECAPIEQLAGYTIYPICDTPTMYYINEYQSKHLLINSTFQCIEPTG